ncbi:hypothetical protein [Sorangium sp. So ce1182]|uniref:hypothetical protein n=1 Tax=Sorangium sp. So ce1182 TaxID=3133334 RepID=UPI003F5D928D
MRLGGLTSAAVSEVLAGLHRTVEAIHGRGVVIILPPQFTLSQLQRLDEKILERPRDVGP